MKVKYRWESPQDVSFIYQSERRIIKSTGQMIRFMYDHSKDWGGQKILKLKMDYKSIAWNVNGLNYPNKRRTIHCWLRKQICNIITRDSCENARSEIFDF